MNYLPFLAAALLLALAPGPGMAYVVARTAAGGRSEGLASCAGTALGGLVHVVAAALGLSVLLARSAIAFDLLKYVGAAYLIYLGIGLLRRRHDPATLLQLPARGAARAFREGILVEALNVKTALFFVAFLPQFVAPTQAVGPQLVFMGTVCVALNTLADVAAVFAAARVLRTDLARATRARLLNRASGATMLGLGVYLAFARREA